MWLLLPLVVVSLLEKRMIPFSSLPVSQFPSPLLFQRVVGRFLRMSTLERVHVAGPSRSIGRLSSAIDGRASSSDEIDA